ncbi:MAG: DUF1080 domain-containing protein [Acidobacteriota bacterium]|nr:DUF1080 domain-containing protein [Acidobacteriota bacterium]
MKATRTFVLAAIALTFATGARGRDGEEWIQLFNGRDLDGWTVKITGYDAGENYADTFRVEDGLLKSTCEGYETFGGRFGHLFYDETFSHYRIRIEYRVVGEQCPDAPEWGYRNSGIMVHGQTPESMGKDQDFPVSIEVQLLGGDSSGPRPTANVCTPGTHVVIDGELVTRHCTESSSPTFDFDEWVTVEAEVRGGEAIRHYVNGEKVLEYEKPQLDDGTPLTSGTISLQAESHPFEFRKVELLPLE